jgi:hypothetical protein
MVKETGQKLRHLFVQSEDVQPGLI